MRTSILASVLLFAVPGAGFANSLAWENSYSAAQETAATKQKPLAIVFGQGPDGWGQVGGGELSFDAGRILSDRYVCCYVDTSTPSGQQLARQFDINGSVGLVLSDHTARLQAFWHQGALSADALTGYL